MELQCNAGDPCDVFHETYFVNRVYGVTGGARGIGRAIARALLRRGAWVMVLDREPVRSNVMTEGLNTAARCRLMPQTVDVTDDSAMREVIESYGRQLGRVDGWVNNAMFNPVASLDQHEEARFEQAWRVNTLAAWRAAKHLQSYFLAANGGAIVNISSIMAHQTIAGYAAYTSSKAGLEGLTRALAIELAERRVRVNALAVGYVQTYTGLPEPQEWTAEDRQLAAGIEAINRSAPPWPDPAMPSDIAAAVLFLLSDAAKLITGATIAVDGGLSVDLRPPRQC